MRAEPELRAVAERGHAGWGGDLLGEERNLPHQRAGYECGWVYYFKDNYTAVCTNSAAQIVTWRRLKDGAGTQQPAREAGRQLPRQAVDLRPARSISMPASRRVMQRDLCPRAGSGIDPFNAEQAAGSLQ